MNDLTHDPDDARSVEANRGLVWWTDAWALFMRSALMWVVLGLILMVGFGVVSLVPLLGAVATAVAAPVFFASWLMAARKVEEGGTLEVGDLFGAFKEPYLTPLLLQGAMLFGAFIVIFLAAAMVGFGALFGLGSGMGHGGGGLLAGLSAGLFAVLLVLGLGTVVSAALWFGPALVVFRGLSAIEALREGFAAVLKNVVPFLLFGLIYFAAAIVASIPFALGWLVLVPVSLLAAYVSYKDVFGDV